MLEFHYQKRINNPFKNKQALANVLSTFLCLSSLIICVLAEKKPTNPRRPLRTSGQSDSGFQFAPITKLSPRNSRAVATFKKGGLTK